jgi:hypothetical protein
VAGKLAVRNEVVNAFIADERKTLGQFFVEVQDSPEELKYLLLV